MRLLQSLNIAFSMYSVFPMPPARWEKENMQWVFACFPAVGAVIGGILWLWLRLAARLSLGAALTGAVGMAFSVGLSGGIHLDGLCDTADAVGSHLERERKLEIMKDPHIGAFGVMGCGIYLLLLFACWQEVCRSGGSALLPALVPVLSRSWVSLAATTIPNARGSGLLATFTSAAAGRRNRVLVLLWLALALVLVAAQGIPGLAAAAASALTALWFYRFSKKEFGGITGDLAGCYLQLLELAMLFAAALTGGL